jgi:hypothetical protein
MGTMPSYHPTEEECLGRTCMKWGQDGELSSLDLLEVLERLGEADAEASGLLECPQDDAADGESSPRDHRPASQPPAPAAGC